MNGKKVRWITALAAALLMQLAVIGEARAQRMPRSLPLPTVEPLQAWFGTQAGGDVLFEIDDDEVYLGPVSAGEKLLSIRYRGRRFIDDGEVVATARRNSLREGTRGAALMTLDGRWNRIFAGKRGPLLYEIRGDRLFDADGKVVLSTNVDLANASAETRLLVALVMERYLIHRASPEQ